MTQFLAMPGFRESLRRYGRSRQIPTHSLHSLAITTIDGVTCIRTTVQDGGLVMVTGDLGMGKSVTLRVLEYRLQQLPDVAVGTIDHSQSKIPDFYRELGDRLAAPFLGSTPWRFEDPRRCC